MIPVAMNNKEIIVYMELERNDRYAAYGTENHHMYSWCLKRKSK